MKKFNADQPGFVFNTAVASVATMDGPFAMQDRPPYVPIAPMRSDAAWQTTSYNSRKPKPYRNGGKRLFDIAMVCACLPFAFSIVAVCSIALWFEGGNPFYRQVRLGKNGRKFSMLKLRTMTQNADKVLEEYLSKDPEMRREWDELQKIKNDPRITTVGAALRATSLDELPQLWNVLRGDMSIVGPRPMMPDQLPLYGNPKSYFALRPGITGLWQISARNSNKFSYRNEVDSAYDETVSWTNDVAVMFKTIGVMMRRTGY